MQLCECILDYALVCILVSVIGKLKLEWLCSSYAVYVVLRDVLAHGKLQVCVCVRQRDRERDLFYLKVNKAGKVVLFVLSGQCQLLK